MAVLNTRPCWPQQWQLLRHARPRPQVTLPGGSISTSCLLLDVMVHGHRVYFTTMKKATDNGCL